MSKLRAIRMQASAAVEAQLPEDEPDMTATWVYDTIIRTALQHVPMDKATADEIGRFEDRLRRRGAALQAAQVSLIERTREFLKKHARTASRTGRPYYPSLVPLSDMEPLRLAFDEYARIAKQRPLTFDSETP